MIMGIIISASKTFLKRVLECTPQSGIVWILLSLFFVVILFLELVPRTHYSFLLYFGEDCIGRLSNDIWRHLFSSRLIVWKQINCFFAYWVFSFRLGFLASRRVLRSFSADPLWTFVFIHETRNVIIGYLKLEFQELWRTNGEPMNLWRRLPQAFSVFFIFHVFKILI